MQHQKFLEPHGSLSIERSPAVGREAVAALGPGVQHPDTRPVGLQFELPSLRASGESCAGCSGESGDTDETQAVDLNVYTAGRFGADLLGPYADVEYGQSVLTTAVRGGGSRCRICIELMPGRRRTVTICYPDPRGGNPFCSKVLVPSRGGPWCSPCIYPCNAQVTITINGTPRGPFLARTPC